MNTLMISIQPPWLVMSLVMSFQIVPEIDFQAGEKPKLVKYYACEETESDFDIRNSISQNRDFLEMHGVKNHCKRKSQKVWLYAEKRQCQKEDQ